MQNTATSEKKMRAVIILLSTDQSDNDISGVHKGPEQGGLDTIDFKMFVFLTPNT